MQILGARLFGYGHLGMWHLGTDIWGRTFGDGFLGTDFLGMWHLGTKFRFFLNTILLYIQKRFKCIQKALNVSYFSFWNYFAFIICFFVPKCHIPKNPSPKVYSQMSVPKQSGAIKNNNNVQAAAPNSWALNHRCALDPDNRRTSVSGPDLDHLGVFGCITQKHTTRRVLNTKHPWMLNPVGAKHTKCLVNKLLWGEN